MVGMNQERINQNRLRPHESGQSSIVEGVWNRYVVKVSRDATKPEITKAVEALYEVQVTAGQVVNVKGKSKGFGRIGGRRSDLKKAYVTLPPGQQIELLSG